MKTEATSQPIPGVAGRGQIIQESPWLVWGTGGYIRQADLPMVLFLSFTSVPWGLLRTRHWPALSGAGQGLERSQGAAKNRPLKVRENLDPWFTRTGRQACRNEAVYPILSTLKGAPVPTISKSKIKKNFNYLNLSIVTFLCKTLYPVFISVKLYSYKIVFL